MAYSGPFPLPIIGGGTGSTSYPAFSAYITSNLTNTTGDGTVYQVICDTKFFDTTTSYSTSTGNFTVPISGNYYFYFNCFFQNIGAGHTGGDAQIIDSTGPVDFTIFQANPTAMAFSGTLCWAGGIIVNLAASATIGFYLTVSGSTKTITIAGDSGSPTSYRTFFGGFLIP